jgi:NitT/TauT family transport system ATP-binding protein
MTVAAGAPTVATVAQRETSALGQPGSGAVGSGSARLGSAGSVPAGSITSDSTAPAIVISGLTKRYRADAPLVLDGVDLRVVPGEFVCLLGASGCGKSTLLSLVAGLERPTTGTIEVPSGRAAVMFQDAALFPWLSARRNVELALRLGGAPRAARRDRALELLALVNLADAAEKRPHELSGGMRQRVALARALAQERDVLLMDEPFAALDAITRDVLHEQLARLQRETGRTIVFVTHNVREAVRLGDRVVLLSSRPGRVAREWDVAERLAELAPRASTHATPPSTPLGTVPVPASPAAQPATFLASASPAAQPAEGRTLESPGVAELAAEITAQLRGELVRHAA